MIQTSSCFCQRHCGSGIFPTNRPAAPRGHSLPGTGGEQHAGFPHHIGLPQGQSGCAVRPVLAGIGVVPAGGAGEARSRGVGLHSGVAQGVGKRSLRYGPERHQSTLHRRSSTAACPHRRPPAARWCRGKHLSTCVGNSRASRPPPQALSWPRRPAQDTSASIAPTLLPTSAKCCTSSGFSALPSTLLSRYDSHFLSTWYPPSL